MKGEKGGVMNHSTKHDGRPSLQFYPGDWRTDSGLQLCSLAARGLWIEMLCLMWVSPKRGCLLEANGKQIEASGLARLVGATEAETKQVLSELDAHDVYSTIDGGTIYNRRMYRQWKLSKSRSEAGRKGGLASKIEAKPLSSSSTSASSPISTTKNEETIYPAALLELIAQWNKIDAQYVAACSKPTKKRLTAYRQRAKEDGWLDESIQAINKMRRGECKWLGSDGWKGNMEWFLRPDSVTKILEGKYDMAKEPAKRKGWYTDGIKPF